jgi:hypothetical protein
MPRATISLALVLAAASLFGCGGHNRAPASATAPAPAATGSGALTAARALAFAHAVNLTATDVPGFTAAGPPRAKSHSEQRAESELFRCAGARGARTRGRSGDVAQASSPSFGFKRGIVDLNVSSEVGVSRSAALARAELAAIQSSRVRTCFTRFLRSVLAAGKPRSASVGHVTIESGNPPAPGASGSFGWRVSATFALAGAQIPVYLDMLGFVYGPARVTLISSGALRPFPAAAQQRLYELLLLRARDHSL